MADDASGKYWRGRLHLPGVAGDAHTLPPPSVSLSLSVSLFAVWQSRRQKERDVIYIFMYR